MGFFYHAGLDEPAPYLIRGHPIVVPMKIGAGMTTFMITRVYGQTLIIEKRNNEVAF
jgi:hypothetical protein